MAHRIGLVLAFLLVFIGCATPATYTAENIDARVVDSVTKQPIPGALVVAMWTLVRYNEYSTVGVLKVEEAVTDEFGRFHISGWGPLPRPSSGVLDVLDPQFVVFKHGYLLGHASNYNASVPVHTRVDASIRTSNWNGRDIELEPDKGDQRRYRASFVGAFGALDRFIYSSADCKWKQFPKMVHAFEKERIYQRSVTGKPYDEVIPDLKGMLASPQCQPTAEFLRAYDEVR